MIVQIGPGMSVRLEDIRKVVMLPGGFIDRVSEYRVVYYFQDVVYCQPGVITYNSPWSYAEIMAHIERAQEKVLAAGVVGALGGEEKS